LPQSFLDTYAVLLSELVNDPMLEGQPLAAQAWLKEVTARAPLVRQPISTTSGR
jgi:hypothetical protein